MRRRQGWGARGCADAELGKKQKQILRPRLPPIALGAIRGPRRAGSQDDTVEGDGREEDDNKRRTRHGSCYLTFAAQGWGCGIRKKNRSRSFDPLTPNRTAVRFGAPGVLVLRMTGLRGMEGWGRPDDLQKSNRRSVDSLGSLRMTSGWVKVRAFPPLSRDETAARMGHPRSCGWEWMAVVGWGAKRLWTIRWGLRSPGRWRGRVDAPAPGR